MVEKNSDNQKNKFELLKSPLIAEFLGFKNENTYLESDLESAILTHIRDFLMEMGKGFAFVARQQHIVTETEDYFIAIEVKATENADKNDARSFTGLQEILNKPLKHCFVLSNDNTVKNFGENITAMHTAAFLG